MSVENNVRGKSIEFISQSRDSYTVKTDTGQVLTIAKTGSAKQDDYSVMQGEFHHKWMQLAVLGLPLGGVLTVIFTPLVIWRNISLLRIKNLSKRERIHAKNLIITTVILFFLGIILFSLFIMHLLF